MSGGLWPLILPGILLRGLARRITPMVGEARRAEQRRRQREQERTIEEQKRRIHQLEADLQV